MTLGRALELAYTELEREGSLVESEREETKVCLARLISDGFLHKPALLYEGSSFSSSSAGGGAAASSSSSSIGSASDDSKARARKSTSRKSVGSISSTPVASLASGPSSSTSTSKDQEQTSISNSALCAIVDGALTHVYRANCAQFINYFQREVHQTSTSPSLVECFY